MRITIKTPDLGIRGDYLYINENTEDGIGLVKIALCLDFPWNEKEGCIYYGKNKYQKEYVDTLLKLVYNLDKKGFIRK